MKRKTKDAVFDRSHLWGAGTNSKTEREAKKNMENEVGNKEKDFKGPRGGILRSS